jgi:hypothetical protein
LDPNQALRDIVDSLDDLARGNEDARTEAVERLRALACWLERGGFAPDTRLITKGGTT